MTTVLLWATLILLTLFLIIIASPTRFKAKLHFRKPDAIEYALSFSYMHPIVLRWTYTAEESKLRIFGFTVKPKKDVVDVVDNGVDGDDGGNKDNNDNSDVDVNNSDNVDIVDNVDNAADVNNTDNINNTGNVDNNIDDITDNKNDKKKNSAPPPKKTKKTLASRIKALGDGIKNNPAYKIYVNVPLRQKLLKWLRRLPIRLFRSITIEKLMLRATIGYRDPAALGKMYGYFSAARSALQLPNRTIDVSMTPIFADNRLEIDSELALKTTLSQVLWQTILILGTFPYWKTYNAIKKQPQ